MFMKKQISRIFLLIFAVGGAIALSITSCEQPIVSTLTRISPTPVTPSPTPRVCPTPQNIASTNDLQLTRSYVAFLVDPTSITDSALEYSNGQRTTDVYEFISVVAPVILGAGDHYAVFQLGVRSYEAARVDRFGSEILEAPEIFPTPSPLSTLTPIDTPIASSSYVLVKYGEPRRL